MLTLTRNKLLSKLNANLTELDSVFRDYQVNYEKKVTSKSEFLTQLTYLLKKIAIIKHSANCIPVKKGEVSNLLLADAAQALLEEIREAKREVDIFHREKLSLIKRTELKLFAEQFKKCLKEHDAEIIINN